MPLDHILVIITAIQIIAFEKKSYGVVNGVSNVASFSVPSALFLDSNRAVVMTNAR
jgi:hypothetical protein